MADAPTKEAEEAQALFCSLAKISNNLTELETTLVLQLGQISAMVKAKFVEPYRLCSLLVRLTFKQSVWLMV